MYKELAQSDLELRMLIKKWSAPFFYRLVVTGSKYLSIILTLLIVSCGPINSPPTPQSPANTSASPSSVEEGYPVASTIASSAYPSSTSTGENNAGYPAPGSEEISEPRFQFDGVLVAGTTNVQGQAVPDLSLAIVDITFGGIVLGTGHSNESGRFSIDVTPLPEGHRVGLAIAELEAGKTLEQMSAELFPHRGEEFMNVPDVGVFFETAVVQP